jgi:hypothetical protein
VSVIFLKEDRSTGECFIAVSSWIVCLSSSGDLRELKGKNRKRRKRKTEREREREKERENRGARAPFLIGIAGIGMAQVGKQTHRERGSR